MIKLTSNVNGKDVYIAINHIVAMYPGTTGSEILTSTGVVYTVKETVYTVKETVDALFSAVDEYIAMATEHS